MIDSLEVHPHTWPLERNFEQCVKYLSPPLKARENMNSSFNQLEFLQRKHLMTH